MVWIGSETKHFYEFGAGMGRQPCARSRQSAQNTNFSDS